MEVFGPHNTSAGLNLNSSDGFSTDPDQLSLYNSKDLSMNDLKTCLTGFFNGENIGSSTNQLNQSTGEDYVVNVVKECDCQGLERNATCDSASEKCLSKCATFPPPCGPKSSVDAVISEKEKQEEDISADADVSEANGSNKPSNKCFSRSKSLPVPLKLVSALKGSREKQGIPPRSLSVTWAPDVYDPVPTSVSHVPSNKNQSYRSNSKKSGKYKQKGASKSSRSSKGKDKKQVRRSSGGFSKLRPFYEDCGASEPQVDTVDFDVGTPDPFCGSSFLKKSVTNLHFSVAEAT